MNDDYLGSVPDVQPPVKPGVQPPRIRDGVGAPGVPAMPGQAPHQQVPAQPTASPGHAVPAPHGSSPAYTAPAAHGSPPAYAAPWVVVPEPEPRSKKKLLWLLVIPILLIGGYVALIVRGQQVEGEITAVADEFFAVLGRGEDIGPLVDGTGLCPPALSFLDIGSNGAGAAWSADDVGYFLESDGEGSNSTTLSTLEDGAADFLLEGRASGADAALVVGELIDGPNTYDTLVALIREPGEKWLICSFETELAN